MDFGLHPGFIFVGCTRHYDFGLFSAADQFNADLLMRHEKCDVTTDNHKNKSTINDPHTGITVYLQPGIKARHILVCRDQDVTLAHLIKTGKAQGQNDLNWVSIDGCQDADHCIADIMTFEFKRGCQISDNKAPKFFRDFYRLSNAGPKGVNLTGFSAGKA